MMAWAGGYEHNYDRDQLLAYIRGTAFNAAFRPKYITLHHTAAPSLAQWTGNWKDTGKPYPLAQRQKNLAHEYRDIQRWSAGPHFFVAPEEPISFWQGTPLNKRGVHAVSFNRDSIGIEMVGNYDVEPFDPRVRDHAVFLLAALFAKIGSRPAPFVLGRSGLHFHRDDPTTRKHCPGDHVDKADMIRRVEAEMSKSFGIDAPKPAAAPAKRVLARGSIEWVQDRLNAFGDLHPGYSGLPALAVDNDLGPKTRRAVTAFQKLQGLPATGRIDAATVSALAAAPSVAIANPKPPSNPET